jgi:predicted GNAT family N-acyltransferase
MEKLIIEKFQKGQEESIFKLIKKVYDEFVAIDYSEEGNQFFYEWINPDKILERQKSQVNLLVALEDSQIIGMIEIRENINISLLFVDQEFHGQGIAKRLFKEALQMVIQRDPTVKKLYVHASPYSIPIYEKLGFVETDTLQENHGIKYLPMEMIVRK